MWSSPDEGIPSPGAAAQTGRSHPFTWVLGLTADGGRPSTLPTDLRRMALDDLGPGPVEWASDTARIVGTRMRDAEPGFAREEGRADAIAELLLIEALARLVGSGLDRFTRRELLSTLGAATEGRSSLAALMRALNGAQAAIADALLRAGERLLPATGLATMMRLLTGEILSFHEHVVNAVVGLQFGGEERARMDDSVNATLLSSLLGGRSAPDRFERATRYPLDRIHVAVVGFSQEQDPRRLSDQAARTLRDMGCERTFHVVHSPTVVYAWGSVGTADELSLRTPAPCKKSTLTVGLPGRGVAGFAASHDEARALQRLAGLAGWRNLGRALPYRDYGVVAELAEHPERLRRFLEIQLGNLLDESRKHEDLRRTTLEYLNSNRSQVEAAHRLYVSKNTVNYRVRRAEELMGRTLGRDTSSLHVALLATEVLGEAAGSSLR